MKTEESKTGHHYAVSQTVSISPNTCCDIRPKSILVTYGPRRDE